MCIENEIENLTEKLNDMVKDTKSDELSKTEILKTSEKLDELITKYYLEHYSQ